MKKKGRKIVTPSDEEIAAYGNDEGRPNESSAAAQDDAQAAPAEDGTSTGEVGSEADQWRDKFLRAKAEMLNYQRRAEKDRSDALRYANGTLVAAILPVLDDLERVVESAREHQDSTQAILEGITLVQENFLKTLRQFHVERIEAQGRPFDPQVHEALMTQPSMEYGQPTVLQEVARGYRLHDRVLRAAKVIVSMPAKAADSVKWNQSSGPLVDEGGDDADL